MKHGDEPMDTLTVREYFAALAMQGMLADPSNSAYCDHGESEEEAIPRCALLFADNLLAALDK